MRSHGKVGTYTNGGCRCDECRTAIREYRRQSQQERRAARVEVGGRMVATGALVHGTYATYVNWSCRCRGCMDAHLAYDRGYRGRAS